MATTVAHPVPSSHVTTNLSPSASSKVIKSLDGLRGLAILSVVAGHYYAFLRVPIENSTLNTAVYFFLWIATSATGVYLFFVLSGFLLFLPYARALLSPQVAWPSTRTFYERRVRRIVPAYLTVFVTIVCYMLFESMQHHTLAQFPWKQLIPGLFLLYGLRGSAFTLIAGTNPLIGVFDGPLWSLTVEWQFYLLLPLIAWGLSRLGSPRRVVTALLLLIVCGLAIRAGIVWLRYVQGVTDPADAPGLLGPVCTLLFGAGFNGGKFIEIFALGMLASLFYVWAIEQGNWTAARQRTLARVLFPISFLTFVFPGLWWTFSVGPANWDRYIAPNNLFSTSWLTFGAFFYGVCGVTLLTSVLCLPHSLGRVFSFWPLTFAGLISYSLYLWHIPLAQLDMRMGMPLSPVLATCFVFAWSAGLYYVVERPFLRYRQKRGGEHKALAH